MMSEEMIDQCWDHFALTVWSTRYARVDRRLLVGEKRNIRIVGCDLLISTFPIEPFFDVVSKSVDKLSTSEDLFVHDGVCQIPGTAFAFFNYMAAGC